MKLAHSRYFVLFIALLAVLAFAHLVGQPLLPPQALAGLAALAGVPVLIGAQVPTGTTFFIASAYASSQNTTIVTNAAEAVVTCAGHGYSNGDFVEATSGWGRLNGRVGRVKSATTDTFALEGIDTSNTTLYPAGQGIGSVRKISTFTQVLKILGASSSGGDPKTANYKYMESDVEYSINDGFNATQYQLQIDADAIGSAGYTALKTLTDVQTPSCLKMVTKSGSMVLYPSTVALNESVGLQDGQINRVICQFNGLGRPTRYAS